MAYSKVNYTDSDPLNGGNRLPDDKIMAPPKAKGKAPIGADGYPRELHHSDPKANGPIHEMTRTEHRGGNNFKKNHSNTGGSKAM